MYTKIDLSTMTPVALVMGVSQIVKSAGLDSRWVPLLNLALGVLFTWLLNFNTMEAPAVIVNGIVVGLVASGLYDTGKHTAAALQQP